MKTRSQTRYGTYVFFTLLMLLTFAIGAQAALAAHFSDGSAVTDPRAGTEGRGGVDGSATIVAVSTSPVAGTEGRGGVSLAVADVTPMAGTQGRGGVDAVQVATISGLPAVGENGFISRGRGGFPGGPLGVQRRLAVSSISTSSAGWAAAALAAAAAVGVFFVWAESRRRAWQRQSALASYCTYHPADSVC